MKYNYKVGITEVRRRSRAYIIVPGIVLIGGCYVLVNTLAPALPPDMTGSTASVTKVLTEHQPALSENRLYVPKIGVDVAIVTGVSEKTLEGGAWHRATSSGDPEAGGNFVLAAHRFNLGLTPDQTRAKSPFYHIDSLQSGDQLFVDYKGVRYAYEVTKRFKTSESDLQIESPSEQAKMTLYSCDLRGPKAGREVIEAKPVGTIAWLNGGPKLKAIQ